MRPSSLHIGPIVRRFLIAVALLSPSAASGDSPQIAGDTEAAMIFLNANKLYADGDYRGARQAYQSLVDAGARDPAVYFNLANAAHKLGRAAEAILYYEKAGRLAPRDRDIKLNLNIARMAAVDEITPLPQHFIFRLGRRFLDYLTLNEKLHLALAGYLLLALGLHLALFFPRRWRGRLWKAVRWSGAAVMIVFGAAAAAQAIGDRNHPRSVVMEEVVRVRAEPDDTGEEIFSIHGGTTVIVEERRGDWIEIRLADGKYGWAPHQAVAYIP